MVRKVGLSLRGVDLLAEVENEARGLLTKFLLESGDGKDPKALGAVAEGAQECMGWLFLGKCVCKGKCPHTRDPTRKGACEAFNEHEGERICWKHALWGSGACAGCDRKHMDLPPCRVRGHARAEGLGFNTCNNTLA